MFHHITAGKFAHACRFVTKCVNGKELEVIKAWECKECPGRVWLEYADGTQQTVDGHEELHVA